VPGSKLGEQYADLRTQAETLLLGMWVFLASELLLFAALFAAYIGYRATYGADFVEAIHHNTLAYGTANMVVLLTSSLTAALAVWAARQTHPRTVLGMLLATVGLGLLFLVIKLAEYAVHIREGALPGRAYHDARLPTFGANRFFTLYWVMTGVHALHVVAGLAVVGWMSLRAWRHAYTPARHVGLEMGTMYWHLVDVIWIFLWPLLYLA
jgi:cytochrome c oxidase subunit 3